MTEQQLSPLEIHRAFSETEHGQILADNVRYARYKPDEITDDRWVELLGADVNNLSHMHLTYRLTGTLIRKLRTSNPGLLNENEEELLVIGAAVHDWGEAIVGDITYSDKTATDNEEEKSAFDEIMSKFSTDGTPDLIARAYEEVVQGKNPKLGRIFNTVERIGYVRTALRAFRHVEESTALDCEEGLRWIAADVFGNHIAALVERVDEFPLVFEFLRVHSPAILRVYTKTKMPTFRNYDLDNRQDKKDTFYQGQAAFEKWHTEHVIVPGKFVTRHVTH